MARGSTAHSRVGRYLLGTVMGVGTFWLGYLLTFLLVDQDAQLRALRAGFAQGTGGATMADLSITPPGAVEYVGWLFYEAHFVGTQMQVSAGVFSGSDSARIGVGPDVYLYLVPPLLLTAAGYLLARRYRTAATPTPLTSLAIVPGYGLMALLGAFLFTWSSSFGTTLVSGTITSRPQLLFTLLLMTVLYPVVFTGLGGVLAAIQDVRGS